jgi:HEPN domain-containing protein
MTFEELRELAEARLREAETLIEAGHFSGSYYLAGYAVELGLKACISKQFKADTIPERALVDKIYKHDLAQLLELAGLKASLNSASKRLEENWQVAKNWTSAARYTQFDEDRAAELLAALTEERDGVMPWIRMQW